MTNDSTGTAPIHWCPSCGKPEHGTIACQLAPELIEVSPGVTIWRYPTLPLPRQTWQVQP